MKIGGVTVHDSLTTERVMEAVERQNTTLDNPGFCVSCGEEAGGCEPDARKYRCDNCEKDTVYGAEEILLYMSF